MAKTAIAVPGIEPAPSGVVWRRRRPFSEKLETIPEEASMEFHGQAAVEALRCALANDCSRREEEAKNGNTQAASNFLNNFHFRRKSAACCEISASRFALLEWRSVFRALFASSLAKLLRRHPENKLNCRDFDLLCDRRYSSYHEPSAMEDCGAFIWW